MNKNVEFALQLSLLLIALLCVLAGVILTIINVFTPGSVHVFIIIGLFLIALATFIGYEFMEMYL